jgi:hypothetical protein
MRTGLGTQKARFSGKRLMRDDHARVTTPGVCGRMFCRSTCVADHTRTRPKGGACFVCGQSDNARPGQTCAVVGRNRRLKSVWSAEARPANRCDPGGGCGGSDDRVATGPYGSRSGTEDDF